MNRRQSIKALAAASVALLAAGRLPVAIARDAKRHIKVYKSPTCGCCKAWVQHVRDAGFTVAAVDVDDVDPYKRKFGVPEDLVSCHTGVIEGYVVEGHVPADLIDRLLREKPKDAKGLAVPGMPMGAPGMEMGIAKDRYDVILFKRNGGKSVFARR